MAVVADLITEFGAFYMDGGQNIERVFKLLNQPSETEQHFGLIVTNDTRWQASKARMGRVLQPFQKAFTPIGGMTFTPIIHDLFPVKIDFQEFPDDIEATWLGFLSSNSLNRTEWPLIRYIIEEHIIPQHIEDYELNEVWGGVFAAPTPGTPGAAGTAVDGLKKQRDDLVTAGTITPITTGPLSANPVDLVNQIEDFVDAALGSAIGKPYKKQPIKLMLNSTHYENYTKGFDEKYNVNYQRESQSMEAYLKYKKNVKVVESAGADDGTDVLNLTPISNMARFEKKGENQRRFRIQEFDREVKIMTDWWKGIGYVIGELLFTNEQDPAVV